MALHRLRVQPGTVALLRIELDTTSLVKESGKAGAFSLREAYAENINLKSAESWSDPVMVERAHPTSVSVEASVTGVPVFSSNAGPDDENVYIIPVDDSSSFSVGDFVRAKDQPEGSGQVFEIVAIPSGTIIRVHAKQANFDIEDGDTVEKVEPTGVYVGSFEFPVDGYLNAGSISSAVRVIVTTINTGDNPRFNSVQTLVWTFDLELDVGSRLYRAG